MWKPNRNQKLFHALCEAPGSQNDSKKAIENTISKQLQYRVLQKTREKYLVQQRR